ncbi:hypothetical protein BaRGS_00029629 [Batillaria attramentaria]|uniref:Alpha/beta hydrolase fold-5 domain-containing protein n=1 Tax=Batillaria attramentaria TaxID=370345 RepID=A0ABD0JWN7_9CAEN
MHGCRASPVVVLLLSPTRAVHVEVLRPVTDTGPEAALLIVPGAFISGQAYRPLGEAIQANCTLRLWVALLEDFLMNLANPLEIGGAVDKALTELSASGMTSDSVFIAGHSLGGGIVSEYAKSHAQRFKGVLFFGHFPDFRLDQFPLPVMTLSGDLDGLVRLTHVMDKFQELSKTMAADADALYRTPVLLVKGVNHGHFASGDMPSTVRQNDLTADVTEVTAHALIAPVVNSFLAPLLETRADDMNPEMTSDWSIRAQTLVAGVDDRSVKVDDHVMSGDDFTNSQPTIVTSSRLVTVSAVTQVVYDNNFLSQSTAPVSPHELQVKMVSRSAVWHALNASEPMPLPLQSCKELNQASLNEALSRASDAAVHRYTSRGIPIILHSDHVTTTTSGWEATKLEFSLSSANVTVTSSVYRTSGETTTSSVVFCKLLSPFRAMEWIYVDSLRSARENRGSLFAAVGK